MAERDVWKETRQAAAAWQLPTCTLDGLRSGLGGSRSQDAGLLLPLQSASQYLSKTQAVVFTWAPLRYTRPCPLLSLALGRASTALSEAQVSHRGGGGGGAAAPASWADRAHTAHSEPPAPVALGVFVAPGESLHRSS